MDKIKNISTFLSFAGLWLTSYVPVDFEIIIGFLFIFSFGILHGSNDILLIESFKTKTSEYTFLKILSLYLLVVLIAVIVFYFVPVLALILFIVFSAFHFGEQHWEHLDLNIGKYLSMVFYFLYGNFILLLLFEFNKAEVVEVVYAITNYNLNTTAITVSLGINAFALGSCILVLIFKSEAFKNQILKELFYLLIFGIIFKVATLIWGFTIYFVFWHSIPSLYEQVSFIYGEYNRKTILNYCKNALPYWVVSLIGIALVYFVFKDETIFYAVFFSFIAAVTFPHSIVINTMFKNKKTQSN
jgi:Brp/Blh family beta-carotene 15,15'-monooxygenase